MMFTKRKNRYDKTCIVHVRKCRARTPKNVEDLGCLREGNSFACSNCLTLYEDMKFPYKNTCYCQNSVASSHSTIDEAESHWENTATSARTTRVNDENRKKLGVKRTFLRKMSPPSISPPSPLLSPDTLTALENAGKMVRDVQGYIREVSSMGPSASLRRKFSKYLDDPPLDDEKDELLYIRELVVSKFYEMQDDYSKTNGSKTSNERPSKESISKTDVRTRLSEPQFNRLEHVSSLKSSRLKEKPRRVIRYQNLNLHARRPRTEQSDGCLFSTQRTIADLNDKFRKADCSPEMNKTADKPQAPNPAFRNFQIQTAPPVHIQGELSVRCLENVHISPDDSFVQTNNNIGTYDFRHESSFEGTQDSEKAQKLLNTGFVEQNVGEDKVNAESDTCQPEVGVKSVLINATKSKKLAKNENDGKVGVLESVEMEDGNKNFHDKFPLQQIEKEITTQKSEQRRNDFGNERPFFNAVCETQKKHDIDLVERFIDSFDDNVLQQTTETGKLQADIINEKLQDNERHYMIDLRLQNIIKKYNRENSIYFIDENNSKYFAVDSVEDVSKKHTLEEICLNDLSLNNLDAVLSTYDRIINRVTRDTEKVTAFLSRHNVSKNKKLTNTKYSNCNKSVPSDKFYEKDNGVIETTELNNSPRKFNQANKRDVKDVQIQTTKYADSVSLSDSESANGRAQVENKLSSVKEKFSINENSWTAHKIEDVFDRTSETSTLKSTLQNSSIKEQLQHAHAFQAYPVNDVKYKVSVSSDNDEGIHVIKSRSSTNTQDSVKLQSSHDTYTSDFVDPQSSTDTRSAYCSQAQSSKHFASKSLSNESDDTVAKDVLSLDRTERSEFNDEFSEVSQTKTGSSGVRKNTENDVANKDYLNSKVKLSDNANALMHSSMKVHKTEDDTLLINSMKSTLENDPSHSDIEELVDEILLKTDSEKCDNKATIVQNIETKNNNVEKQPSISTSAISNVNNILSSRSGPLQINRGNSVESKLNSDQTDSTGHLSSSKDSLRDCVSLQTMASYTESNKSFSKNNRRNPTEVSNVTKHTHDAKCKGESNSAGAQDKNNEEQIPGTSLFLPNVSVIKNLISNSFSASSCLLERDCRSASSVSSVETASNTRSDGELYMPSSCSYSLGEIRIVEKNNSSISQEVLKPDSASTFFVTRNMLTSFTKTDNSAGSSPGEIY